MTPQNKGAEVERDEKGRIVRGTLNPGGRPKWVAALVAQLEEHAVGAIDLLRSVVAGEPAKMQIDGREVEVTPSIETRIRAAEIVLAYTLPKPKQAVEIEGQVATSGISLRDVGLSEEQIVELARKALVEK